MRATIERMRPGQLPVMTAMVALSCMSSRGPIVDEVEPSQVASGSTETVNISGSNFFLVSSVDNDEVNSTFALTLTQGNDRFELGDVRWISSTQLRAQLPTTLGDGFYALDLLDPAGRRAQLDSAIQVGSDADAGASDAAPPIAPILFNINGPTVVGVDYPGTWQADPGQGGVCAGANSWNEVDAIDNTVDDALLQTMLYGPTVTCAIGGGALPSGTYELRLLFVEVFRGTGCPSAGQRLLDIAVEGTTLATDFDIHALGGCATNGGSPVEWIGEVLVNDGTADVLLTASAFSAQLSAIAIVAK